MESLYPDITLDSPTSVWNVSRLEEWHLEHRNARDYLCTKAEKVFDTTVHKSFQRFHIYYISFTETDYLNP